MYDSGLFSPVENLSTLSDTDFTTLSHPAFPHHGVRIKKTSVCDDTVQYVQIFCHLLHTYELFFFARSYTGYIDIEARHLFFYFFESRNDPDKDDVIFWTNGGNSYPYFLRLSCINAITIHRSRMFVFSWIIYGIR